MLGDIIVYCRSEALKYGIPLEEVLDIIMDSNESKLGADGKPIYDENGKFLKGPNYWKPEPKIREMLEVGSVFNIELMGWCAAPRRPQKPASNAIAATPNSQLWNAHDPNRRPPHRTTRRFTCLSHRNPDARPHQHVRVPPSRRRPPIHARKMSAPWTA